MRIKNVGNFCSVRGKAEGGKLTAVASTSVVDRDGEVILPSAFARHLDRYLANPVILAAHTHRSADGMPTILGSATRVAIESNALVFDMTFARTPLAEQWRSLYEDGHARAFSVGFIPLAGEWKEQAEGNVYVWTEVELLEISAVPVPANPEALARDVCGEELERLIDERVRKALREMYLTRLSALFE